MEDELLGGWLSVSSPGSPRPSVCGFFRSKPASGPCGPSGLGVQVPVLPLLCGVHAIQEAPPCTARACIGDKTPSTFHCHSFGTFTRFPGLWPTYQGSPSPRRPRENQQHFMTSSGPGAPFSGQPVSAGVSPSFINKITLYSDQ